MRLLRSSNRLRLAVAGLCGLFALCGPLRAARAQEARPPTPGLVTGVVVDKSSAAPLANAVVEVVGRSERTRTTPDGKFVLNLPPGTYDLRFYAPMFQPVRLERLVVTAGGTSYANASLPPAGAAGVERVEVVAPAGKASEETQLLLRKEAAVVAETIGAESIKKTTASDAAEVVQRAPAILVKDDRLVFIRGLNERYVRASVNQSRLPSTDPQRRVVPLDLFPADFLDALAVIKSYTPDLPGDFSGGLVALDLRDFPEQYTLSLGFSTSGNTQTTFQDFDSYRGSKYDYLGFGKDFRDIPEGFPDTETFVRLPDGPRFTQSRRFRNIWAIEPLEAPPNFGANAAVGNTLGPFGFQLGVTYSNEYKFRTEETRQFINAGTLDEPVISARDDFIFDVSQFQTKLGAVLTSAYEVRPDQRLTFRGFINRGSLDEVINGSGTNNNLNPDQRLLQTRLRYTEEQLGFLQVGGDHRWKWLELDWRSAYSRTRQDEPDIRHTTYVKSPGEPPVATEDSSGGLRVFNSLSEYLSDSRLDFTVPFPMALPFSDAWSGLRGKFKWGLAYAFRDRTFQQRRFRNQILAVDATLPPEELFAPDNLRPGVIDLIEQTAPEDFFAATEEIAAAYGMFEVPLVRDVLRVVGGVRYEYSLIRLQTFDELGQEARPRKKNTNPLPGANVIFSPRPDMNVRFGFSRTVARPEFRELSPVVYPAPRGLRPLVGNPELVQSDIESWDLRWEWFFSPLELFSASFFYKTLEKPIETVTISQASNIADSFSNADSATLYGFEVEVRKDFGFLARALQHLSLQTNVTWSKSEATIPRGEFQLQTNLSRQLQGQSPFIVNAALDYTHPTWGTVRVGYNTSGPRLDSVGSFGLPDIFEERRDQLDAVILLPLKQITGTPLTLKVGLENLLNDRVLYSQGDEVQRRFTSGIKAGLGISFSF